MNDISKDKDYQEFFAGIKELAKGLMQIRERAAIEYAPIVEEFCARKHATAVSVSAMLVDTRQKNIAQVFILERYFFVSICPAAIPGTCLSVFLAAVLPLC